MAREVRARPRLSAATRRRIMEVAQVAERVQVVVRVQVVEQAQVAKPPSIVWAGPGAGRRKG